MEECNWHLCKNEVKTKQSKYCSVQCKNKNSVTRYRRRSKEKAVEYKGGECEKCGYNKCLDALQFHHLDPTHKEFGIAAKGVARTWETLVKELDKCIMVCANCHSEIHASEKIIAL